MKKEEMIEKFADKKRNDANDLFNNMYEKYKNRIEADSGGLVTVDKSEFLKLYYLYIEIIQPDMMKLWEAYLGSNK